MSGRASTVVKQAAAILVHRSGFLRAWIRWKLGKRPLLVMYHRVLESGSDFSQDGIVVCSDTFERQLLFLARMFKIVPLNVACEGNEAFRCAITFDDGWADNHRLAFPELRRLGLPATLFVTTGYIGTPRLFWPERLAFILQGLKPGELHEGVTAGLPEGIAQCLPRLSRASDGAHLDRLIELLKEVDEKTREDFLERLAHARNRESAPLESRMLDWDQVRDLHRQGFEIGSHTVNHVLLTQADPFRAEEEIGQSRKQIAAELQWAPQSFAYPNGNWNPDLTLAVRKAGYVRAVTTDLPWTASAEIDSTFALPRKNLCEGSSKGLFGFSSSVFACEAVGFFDWCRLSWKKQQRR